MSGMDNTCSGCETECFCDVAANCVIYSRDYCAGNVFWHCLFVDSPSAGLLMQEMTSEGEELCEPFPLQFCNVVLFYLIRTDNPELGNWQI